MPHLASRRWLRLDQGMHRPYALVLATALALASAACGKKINPIHDCANDPNNTQDPNEKVSFDGTIKAITASNCGCHYNAVLNRQNAPTRVVLDTYNDTKTWADESHQAILGGTMPPESNMKIDDICAFDAWYRNGMAP